MPQMGPLLWLNLFSFFIIIFFIFLVLTFFFIPPLKNINKASPKPKMNFIWKW